MIRRKMPGEYFSWLPIFFFLIFFSTPIVKLRFNFHSPSARWFSFKYGSYLLDFWSAFPIMELYTVISSHRKCMIIIIMSILYTYSIVIFKFVRYCCNSRLKFEFKLRLDNFCLLQPLGFISNKFLRTHCIICWRGIYIFLIVITNWNTFYQHFVL